MIYTSMKPLEKMAPKLSFAKTALKGGGVTDGTSMTSTLRNSIHIAPINCGILN